MTPKRFNLFNVRAFNFTIKLTLCYSGRHMQALVPHALHRKVAEEGCQHAALPHVPAGMGHSV
jgi:hypothetical protein